MNQKEFDIDAWAKQEAQNITEPELEKKEFNIDAWAKQTADEIDDVSVDDGLSFGKIASFAAKQLPIVGGAVKATGEYGEQFLERGVEGLKTSGRMMLEGANTFNELLPDSPVKGGVQDILNVVDYTTKDVLEPGAPSKYTATQIDWDEPDQVAKFVVGSLAEGGATSLPIIASGGAGIVPAYAMAVGDVREAIREEAPDLDPNLSAALAMVGAVPYALLDKITPDRISKTLGLNKTQVVKTLVAQAREALKKEAKDAGKKGVAKKVLKEVSKVGGKGLVDSGIEGSTETGQSVITDLTASIAAGDSVAEIIKKLNNNVAQYVDEFAAGAVSGGGMSVGAEALSRVAPQSKGIETPNPEATTDRSDVMGEGDTLPVDSQEDLEDDAQDTAPKRIADSAELAKLVNEAYAKGDNETAQALLDANPDENARAKEQARSEVDRIVGPRPQAQDTDPVLEAQKRKAEAEAREAEAKAKIAETQAEQVTGQPTQMPEVDTDDQADISGSQMPESDTQNDLPITDEPQSQAPAPAPQPIQRPQQRTKPKEYETLDQFLRDNPLDLKSEDVRQSDALKGDRRRLTGGSKPLVSNKGNGKSPDMLYTQLEEMGLASKFGIESGDQLVEALGNPDKLKEVAEPNDKQYQQMMEDEARRRGYDPNEEAPTDQVAEQDTEQDTEQDDYSKYDEELDESDIDPDDDLSDIKFAQKRGQKRAMANPRQVSTVLRVQSKEVTGSEGNFYQVPVPETKSHRFLTVLAGRLGRNIVWYKSRNGDVAPGFVDSAAPDTVFLQADAYDDHRAMQALLGHELLHSIRNEDKDLYDSLIETIKQGSPKALEAGEQGYLRDAEAADPEYAEAIKDRRDVREEEGAAYLFELGFDDFKMLRDADPSLLNRLRRYVQNLWAKIRKQPQNETREQAIDALRGYLEVIDEVEKRAIEEDRVIEPTVAPASTAPNTDEGDDEGAEGMEDGEGEVRQAQRRNPQTETQAFKDWFKDSKVVDESGEPRILYHATPNDFNEFKTSRGVVYLSETPEGAEKGALSGAFGYGGQESQNNIMPVYASASKIYGDSYSLPPELPDVTGKYWDNAYDEFLQALDTSDLSEYAQRLAREEWKRYHTPDENGIVKRIDSPDGAYGDKRRGLSMPWQVFEENGLEAIKKLGYDGARVSDEGGRSLAVFDPTQIKSATGNNGEFNPENPDIRYSFKRNPQTQTDAFKRWFGDSKITDEDGEPEVWYHQTAKENVSPIEEDGFDISKMSARAGDNEVADGVFLKPTPDDIQVGASGEDAAQIPVYVSIQNPLTVNNREELVSLMKQDEKYLDLLYDRKALNADYKARFDEIWNSDEFKKVKRGEPGWKENFEKKKAALDEVLKAWGNFEVENAIGSRELITTYLRSNGYDGLRIKNDVGSFNRSTETLVALEPTQIKSATRNIGDFSLEKPGIRYSFKRDLAPTTYSALTRNITDKMPNAMPAQDFKNWVSKQQGIKEEEIEFTGLMEWADRQEGKVSKDDVLEYLEENQVNVEVVEKGGPLEAPEIAEMRDRFQEFADRLDNGEELTADEQAEYDEILRELSKHPNPHLSKASETKYGPDKDRTLSLPGAKEGTYREMLLTWPPRKLDGVIISDEPYLSSHFDEPNILAHLRFNERESADGKRTMFLEEVQSDWATSYRKNSENTPVAPFVRDPNKWPELALKHALRYASENDLEQIAWTTGEQQADRYDLSKQIDKITWIKRSEDEAEEAGDESGGYAVFGWRGAEAPFSEDFDLSGVSKNPINGNIAQMDEVLGKEIAAQILDSTEEEGEIEGADLKVGGEGMKGFYNKILPNIAKKVVKKLDKKHPGVEVMQLGGQVDGKFKYIGDDGSIIEEYDTREDALEELKRQTIESFLGVSDDRDFIFSQNDKGKWTAEMEEMGFVVEGYDTKEEAKDAVMEEWFDGLDFDGYIGSVEEPAPSSQQLAIQITPTLKEKVLYEGQARFAQKREARRGVAFHGSPHEFDRFDISKVGSGEGAQVYGHGLYFAGAKEVGQYYKEKFALQNDMDSYANAREREDVEEARLDLINKIESIDNLGFDHAGQAISAIRTHSDWASRWDAEDMKQPIEEALSKYNKALNDADAFKGAYGYEVNLAPEEDEYLLWDKPLSEQSEKVKQILSPENMGLTLKQRGDFWGYVDEKNRLFGSAMKDKDAVGREWDRLTASTLYHELQTYEKSAQEASNYLKSLGIPGIKYLDGVSRGDGDGSYNYVIFDDKDIEITGRFAQKRDINPEQALKVAKSHLRNAINKSFTGKIKDMFLVGSLVRNDRDFTEESDIDVAVVIGKQRGFRDGLKYTEEWHMRNRDFRPSINGHKIDLEFFFEDDPELEQLKQGMLTTRFAQKRERSLPQSLEASGRNPGTDLEYEPITNQGDIDAAKERIVTRGPENVTDDLLKIEDKEKFTSKDFVTSLLMLDQWQQEADIARNEGDEQAEEYAMNRVLDLSTHAAQKLTEAGQLVQSASIISRLDPGAVVLEAQKRINKMNDKLGENEKPKVLDAKEAMRLRELAENAKKWGYLTKEAKRIAQITSKMNTRTPLNQNDKKALVNFVKTLRRVLGKDFPFDDPKKSKKLTGWKAVMSEKWQAKEDAALERIKKRGVVMNVGIPVDLMADYVVIGTNRAIQTGLNFASWAEEMVDAIGIEDKDTLKEVFDKVKRGFTIESKRAKNVTSKIKVFEDYIEKLAEEMSGEFYLGEKIDAQKLADAIEYVQSTTGDAQVEAAQEVQQALNMLKTPTLGDKVSTGQTIGHLLNTKTNVRNILGNEAFYRLERLNKYSATGIDYTRSKLTGSDRTVTFSKGGQSGYWEGLMKGARLGWKGIQPGDLTTQFELNPMGPVFRDKRNPLYWMERALGATLRGFDYAAYTRAKRNTLGELAELAYMNSKATGDKETFIKEFIERADAEANDIAHEYGKYVTFQEDSALADAFSGVKQTLNYIGTGGEVQGSKRQGGFGLGDLVLKYAKTPANLIQTALDYSPVGVMRSMFMMKDLILKGKGSPREVTEALSRGLVGSLGTSLMGAMLYDLGILTGDDDDWGKDAFLREQGGMSSFQVNVSALTRYLTSLDRRLAKPRKGDVMYSYDWLQPMAINIAIGASVMESVNRNMGKAETAGNMYETGIKALGAGVNTIMGQSLLQGLMELVPSRFASDDDESKWTTGLQRVVEGVPSQMIPSFVNHIRSLADNTRRVTSSPKAHERAFNRMVDRIPFLAETLPEAYKTFGVDEKSVKYEDSNFAVDAFNVLLNPGFMREYGVKPEAARILEVYEESGDDKVLQDRGTTSIQIGKNDMQRIRNRRTGKPVEVSGVSQRIKLKGEDRSKLQALIGRYSFEEFKKIEDRLDNMDADRQAKEVAKAMNKGYDRAKDWFIKDRLQSYFE